MGTFTDAFPYANGGLVGGSAGNWISATGSEDVTVVSTHIESSPGLASVDEGVLTAANASGQVQFAQGDITFGTNGGNYTGCGLAVRGSTGANYYCVQIGMNGTDRVIDFFKRQGSSFTLLASTGNINGLVALSSTHTF